MGVAELSMSVLGDGLAISKDYGVYRIVIKARLCLCNELTGKANLAGSLETI